MAEFKKNLNLFDATAIVIGSMIGSGIFIVSSDMARTLGSPGYLLLAWVLTGVMTVFAAVSFGELAAMMPAAGGHYIYLKEAYNPLTGFLYGWTLFAVIQTGTIAAVAVAFAKFSGILIPWISTRNVLFSLGIINFNTQHLCAIGSIVFLTWVNTRGINESKTVQNIFTWLKIIILIAFVILGLSLAGGRLAARRILEGICLDRRKGGPAGWPGPGHCLRQFHGGIAVFSRCLVRGGLRLGGSEKCKVQSSHEPFLRDVGRVHFICVR